MKDFKFVLVIGADLVGALSTLQETIKKDFSNLPVHLSNIFVLPELKATIQMPNGQYFVSVVGVLQADKEGKIDWPEEKGQVPAQVRPMAKA
jgi:hypothetical protein